MRKHALPDLDHALAHLSSITDVLTLELFDTAGEPLERLVMERVGGGDESWNRFIDRFPNDAKMAIAEIRAGLPPADTIAWEDRAFDVFGAVELHGYGPCLDIRLLTSRTGPLKRDSEEDHRAAMAYIEALLGILWGPDAQFQPSIPAGSEIY